MSYLGTSRFFTKSLSLLQGTAISRYSSPKDTAELLIRKEAHRLSVLAVGAA